MKGRLPLALLIGFIILGLYIYGTHQRRIQIERVETQSSVGECIESYGYVNGQQDWAKLLELTTPQIALKTGANENQINDCRYRNDF